jgi:GT2 family glycosyltransferase
VKRRRGAAPREPRCSIVIPVHNQAGLTAQCIDAILASPPEVAFEIVVVDDASTDHTPVVLDEYTEPVRVLRRDENAGFARACNQGAAEARGELLVFLNNDTIPLRGWLDALVDDADGNPDTAVVGAKLLFPNDTVQHAGVVVCQDGNPRHLYAGFPGDHPAVNKTREFQAVTAACMLVRREAFEHVAGFDSGYRNSLEDVDLCLRLGAEGHGVRLCHRSVLYHLESVSRGRRSEEIAHSRKLFAKRWADKAVRDDMRYYVEDDLLSIGYRDSYPLTLRVSPLLAWSVADGLDDGGMIELQAGQVGALLRETVRLTSHVAELELDTSMGAGNGTPVRDAPEDGDPNAAHVDSEVSEQLTAELVRIEGEILDFQGRIADVLRGRPHRRRQIEVLSPGPALAYSRARARLQKLVRRTVPAGATVLVVSRGDRELLDLGMRTAWHFPSDDDGQYTGYHPKDSAEAIERLEHQRKRGADWLVIPEPSAWWLEHYEDFGRHLRERYEVVAEDADSGLVLRLSARDEKS